MSHYWKMGPGQKGPWQQDLSTSLLSFVTLTKPINLTLPPSQSSLAVQFLRKELELLGGLLLPRPLSVPFLFRASGISQTSWLVYMDCGYLWCTITIRAPVGAN